MENQNKKVVFRNLKESRQNHKTFTKNRTGSKTVEAFKKAIRKRKRYRDRRWKPARTAHPISFERPCDLKKKYSGGRMNKKQRKS